MAEYQSRRRCVFFVLISVLLVRICSPSATGVVFKSALSFRSFANSCLAFPYFTFAFVCIAAAEAETAFHTYRLLLIWLSCCTFYAFVALFSTFTSTKYFVSTNAGIQRMRQVLKWSSNFLSDTLFATGLSNSQMANPQKVSAFLIMTKKAFDPTLLVLLCVTQIFAIPGLWFLRSVLRVKSSTFGDEFAEPTKPNEPFQLNLLIGALIFGIGWGLCSVCPGPMYVNLGAAALNGSLKFSSGILTFFLSFLVGHSAFRLLTPILFNSTNATNNSEAKINATICYSKGKASSVVQLEKSKSLEELFLHITNVVPEIEGGIKTLVYSEGDKEIIPLNDDDNVEMMHASWFSKQTSRDKNARLTFFVNRE